MLKKIVLTVTLATTFLSSPLLAQSRVFKEVSNEISSQVKAIMQDDALIGYVVLSKLEKVNADSFGYKLSIMDENLNDIGSCSFRNTDLELQQVAFEKDVLCLTYLKNTFIKPTGKVKVPKVISNTPWWLAKPKEEKDNYYKYDSKNIRSFIYSQFLDLHGTLVNTSQVPVKLIYDDYSAINNTFNGVLKNSIKLITLQDRGFCYIYGDGPSEYPEEKQYNWTIGAKNKSKESGLSDEKILVYDLSGNKTWDRVLPREKSAGLGVINQGSYVYILRKNITKIPEGGYELITYNLDDSNYTKKHLLTDKSGAQLKVLSFKKNPSSNMPHISGMVINPEYNSGNIGIKHLSRAVYTGVFDLKLKESDLISNYSYWSDGSKKDIISKRGYIKGAKSYSYFNYSFDDYSGNTYYIGTGVHKKTRWAGIGVATITAPLIIPPVFLLAIGIKKVKFGDAIMLQQNPQGNLNYYSSFSTNNSNYVHNSAPFYLFHDKLNKDFFLVQNENNHSNYVILDDDKDIFIYDINTKKTIRTIPHRDGKIKTEAVKAKSGYIMLVESNKAEKSTKLSIEAL